MSHALVNVVLCGDGVAEIDALVAALVTRGPVPIPDKGLMACIENNSKEAAAAPEVVNGDKYGNPPRLTIPFASITRQYPTAAATLEALSAASPLTSGGEGLQERSLVVNLYHAVHPETLIASPIKAHALLLCFVASVPSTFHGLEASWLQAIDRLYPRPPLTLCAARSEVIGTRAVAQLMRENGTVPLEPDEICDQALRWRCVTHIEVSAALNVNISELEAVLIRSLISEPEKRLTPEAIFQRRQECVHAAAQRESIWSARRNPKTNRLYFVNRLTKKAQWHRPPDYDGEEPELTREERLEEEQRKLKEDELRLQQEREEQDLHLYRSEMEEYDARMRDKTIRNHTLTVECNRLRSMLDTLRERQQININERQALERQKEELGLEELQFTKTSADVDLELDARIQIAKTKIFELEAVAALNAEDQFIAEMSETMVTKRGMASSIRELLREDVAIQQRSTAAMSAFDAATKRKDTLLRESAEYDQRTQAAIHERRRLEQLTATVISEERALLAKRTALQSADQESSTATIRRHEQYHALSGLLETLDKEILALRRAQTAQPHHGSAPHGAASVDSSHLEKQRVTLQMEQILNELAGVAASVSLHEVAVKKSRVLLEYILEEWERVSGIVLHRLKDEADGARSSFELLRDTSAYSPVAPAGLERLVDDVIQQTALRLAQAEQAEDERRRQRYGSSWQPTTTTAPGTRKSRGVPAASPSSLAELLPHMTPQQRDLVKMFQEKIHEGSAANVALKRAKDAEARYASASNMVTHTTLELREALDMGTEALERLMNSGGRETSAASPVVVGLGGATPWERLRDAMPAEVRNHVPWMDMLYRRFSQEVLRRVEQQQQNASCRIDLRDMQTAAASLKQIHERCCPNPAAASRVAREAAKTTAATLAPSSAPSTLHDDVSRMEQSRRALQQSQQSYSNTLRRIKQQIRAPVTGVSSRRAAADAGRSTSARRFLTSPQRNHSDAIELR